MPKDEFNTLLELLDRDGEKAARKYEHIRLSLVTYFSKQPDVYDPEELAAEAINRVTLKIAAGNPLSFEPGQEGAYFFTVAKYVLSEHYRGRRKAHSLEDIPPFKEPRFDPAKEQREIEAWFNREGMLECLRSCLAELTEADRALLIEYYRGETGRKAGANSRKVIRRDLASSLGISSNALKIRAARIKRWLEGCLNNCLKKSAGD